MNACDHNTIIFIDMVGESCMVLVGDLLDRRGWPHEPVQPNHVVLLMKLTPEQEEDLQQELMRYKLVLMKRKEQKLVAEIKNLIIREVQKDARKDKIRITACLTRSLPYNYTYMNDVFKRETGHTISRYTLLVKVERAKALIAFDDLTFSEIAYMLGFSSPSHFSFQFRNITGITPGEYRQAEQKKRNHPENL